MQIKKCLLGEQAFCAFFARVVQSDALTPTLSHRERDPHKIMPAQTPPSPLRERAGVRGNIRLWWLFRSLYVPCYSVTTIPVNVPWRLNRRRPGDPGSRQENRRFAIPSSYSLRLRVGRNPASMQVAPSPRFHARRPGLRSTTQRFTAGPWSRFYC